MYTPRGFKEELVRYSCLCGKEFLYSKYKGVDKDVKKNPGWSYTKKKGWACPTCTKNESNNKRGRC